MLIYLEFYKKDAYALISLEVKNSKEYIPHQKHRINFFYRFSFNVIFFASFKLQQR